MKKKLCLAGILLSLMAAFLWRLWPRNQLTLVNFTVGSDVTEPVRIVHLTDLHSWEFGEQNQELIQMVAEQKPDLILMTGDMLDKTDEDAHVACELIEKLVDVAPVYYGYGNHEKAWERENGKLLETELTAAGAVVLDCDYADIEVNNQKLRIGGYHGYYRRPHMLQSTDEQQNAENQFFDEFENTDQYIILLCHIPTAWLDWGMIDDQPVDLVLTGHYHGGQVRLPFIGGLIAPYVGWFPEYTEGMYTGEAATAILSTGLGSSPGIPRINNPPQVVVVDLVPQK